MSGKLLLISTPIGNLDDLTFRALKELKNASLIAAEDTRRARKLLNHFDIQCPVIAYHMHNEKSKTSSLLERVNNGETVAVISDAGTPCLSDPGYILVKSAVECGIEPEIIPGVSALTYAVAACGFPVTDFHFGGFLPQKSGKRRSTLKRLVENSKTLFIYESPFRINKLLLEISEEVGPATRVVLIREATKMYEEHIRGNAADLLETYKDKKWKGEFTVAITL